MYVFSCKPQNPIIADYQHIYIPCNYMKHHTKRLIIWRSLVQAQAGPQTERLILNRMEPFLFADPPDMIVCPIL
ncbi:hypothetical protein DW804_15195 [Bacteroides stercoris]|nr:hypothetical protein DW804_15195 [Bacteroides stercoris]